MTATNDTIQTAPPSKMNMLESYCHYHVNHWDHKSQEHFERRWMYCEERLRRWERHIRILQGK
jgi:hypothetical protein